jgi:23S rRNA (cytidine2498-2'-O)-methyltransferase
VIAAYLAADGFEGQLREELQRSALIPRDTHGRLLICDGPAMPSAWAANIWHDCLDLPVASIGTAAKALRDIQRNWAMYAPLHHRRAALVQEKLPHVSAKPVVFLLQCLEHFSCKISSGERFVRLTNIN